MAGLGLSAPRRGQQGSLQNLSLSALWDSSLRGTLFMNTAFGRSKRASEQKHLPTIEWAAVWQMIPAVPALVTQSRLLF